MKGKMKEILKKRLNQKLYGLPPECQFFFYQPKRPKKHA